MPSKIKPGPKNLPITFSRKVFVKLKKALVPKKTRLLLEFLFLRCNKDLGGFFINGISGTGGGCVEYCISTF